MTITYINRAGYIHKVRTSLKYTANAISLILKMGYHLVSVKGGL